MHTYQLVSLTHVRSSDNTTQQNIPYVKRLMNILVDRLLSVCAQMVDGYIGQRMFLCTICSLEHFCTNRQPNIVHKWLENILVDRLLSVCTQTVDEYFGRPFAVRLCTND